LQSWNLIRKPPPWERKKSEGREDGTENRGIMRVSIK